MHIFQQKCANFGVVCIPSTGAGGSEAVMLPQIFILIKIENLISADGHILRCPGSNITEYTLELKTKVRKGPYFYLGLLIAESAS